MFDHHSIWSASAQDISNYSAPVGTHGCWGAVLTLLSLIEQNGLVFIKCFIRQVTRVATTGLTLDWILYRATFQPKLSQLGRSIRILIPVIFSAFKLAKTTLNMKNRFYRFSTVKTTVFFRRCSAARWEWSETMSIICSWAYIDFCPRVISPHWRFPWIWYRFFEWSLWSKPKYVTLRSWMTIVHCRTSADNGLFTLTVGLSKQLFPCDFMWVLASSNSNVAWPMVVS